VRGGRAGSRQAQEFARTLEQHTVNFAFHAGRVLEVGQAHLPSAF
jgi:hypothetical protein